MVSAYRTTTGVPTAAAMWTGPVLFATKKGAIAIKAASSFTLSLPTNENDGTPIAF